MPGSPEKRWLQKLPLFVLLVNVFLSVLYCLKIIRMDLVAVDCMFIVILLEACIQSGLIRSNSGYERLFTSALLEAQVLDKTGWSAIPPVRRKKWMKMPEAG